MSGQTCIRGDRLKFKFLITSKLDREVRTDGLNYKIRICMLLICVFILGLGLIRFCLPVAGLSGLPCRISSFFLPDSRISGPTHIVLDGVGRIQKGDVTKVVQGNAFIDSTGYTVEIEKEQGFHCQINRHVKASEERIQHFNNGSSQMCLQSFAFYYITVL